MSLVVQNLSNGAVAPTVVNQSVRQVDQGEYSAFLSQLKSLGIVSVANSGNVNYNIAPAQFNISTGAAAPSSTGTLSSSTPTGMIAAGSNLTVGGGNLVNEGLLYAGNNVGIASGTLTNQGGNQQNYSSQVGCASGVPNAACGNAGQPRGNNPTTTTFSYAQNNATIYAGHDLVIAAGQINNTYGNLLAGHDIVIGGVGSTAGSTTPAQSLNNTSGNIVAGNDIKLNVSGAITNNLPPPVPVHENYGKQEKYSGCMTAGGYKESYCEGYVDQQSGSSSVISAGNNLQVSAGSLTNIGSLIAAGNNATISVAGPVVNEAQVLNAYWHSHWVQETGMFSSDKRHDIWACGTPEQCKTLYGSAYTGTGGTIDPPMPVGNIAATIQAPNLSISSGGQIQNVGNVLGTSVSLSGQKLINGITTPNTYTPQVGAPQRVITLSPVTLPGLNLSIPRAVGMGTLPTPVAGKASYVNESLGGSGLLGAQDLLNNLPSNLQPSSTLFYFNPQEENLLLQQAALQQTGKSSFVDGLSYDSKHNKSVTEQEKEYLYGNALDYSKSHGLQLGAALTQEQINTLDKPMLWYVEQTVPDPTCHATGTATCPTITALMPQVYLSPNTTAMSAGGNIAGTDVALKFNQDGNGSILNTGSITASGTLSVDTHTLTNQANQVNVGEIWQKVDGGYLNTTGTVVQPGGFMSAANMELNVQALNQIGGALQKLTADGTIDQAGTQQALAALQQQLGGNFTQTAVTDNLHQDFVKEGGSFGMTQIFSMVVAVAAAIMMQPEISAAIASMSGAAEAATTAAFMAAQQGLTGAAITAAASAAGGSLAVGGLANTMIAVGLSSFASSALGQVVASGKVDFGASLKNGLIGAVTAGLTNGITFDSGSFGFSANAAFEGSAPSLSALAGVQTTGNALVPQAGAAAGSLPTAALAMSANAAIQAGTQTLIGGGSFLDSLRDSFVRDAAAAAAYAIGNAQNAGKFGDGISGELGYLTSHAALGCAAGAATGQGCGGGAIGGAVGAAFSADAIKAIDPSGMSLDAQQRAVLAAFATLAGGSLSGLAGQDLVAGATAAQNEALNNAAGDDAHTAAAAGHGGVLSGSAQKLVDWLKWTYNDPVGDTQRALRLFFSVGSRNGQDAQSDPNRQFDFDGGPKSNGPSAPAVVTPIAAIGCLMSGGVGCALSALLGAAPVSAPPPANVNLSSSGTEHGGTNSATGRDANGSVVAGAGLPEGYATNVDGTVTGPKGGKYSPTRAVDGNGNPIFIGGNGNYYTLGADGASRVASPNPATGIGATGQIGESALAALGGQRNVSFPTTEGMRFVDRLTPGNIANEAKVGYTSLDSFTKTQVVKDIELMKTGVVNGVTWNFYTSPVTGMGGPSPGLLKMLNDADIKVVIHK
ncbi:DUF637 domain-containing protein [Burkholderia contaminans]|uniref:DUF637 domain-containing protein n=1 Tax=Burkholderia contaminans TaxID=488447 RepID=UPI003B0022AF